MKDLRILATTEWWLVYDSPGGHGIRRKFHDDETAKEELRKKREHELPGSGKEWAMFEVTVRYTARKLIW